MNSLTNIFTTRVGSSYDEEETIEIFKECDKRYKNKIPLGYKDEHKDSPKKYGDYIIWKQLLDYSKSKKKSIVFITSERKEDWWLIKEKLTIGPRPELINEFILLTNYNFYMYHIDVFMEKANHYLQSKIKKAAITETKEIQKDYYIIEPNIVNLTKNYAETGALEFAKASLENFASSGLLATAKYLQGQMSNTDLIQSAKNLQHLGIDSIIASSGLAEIAKGSLDISKTMDALKTISFSPPKIKSETESTNIIEDSEEDVES